PAETSCLHLAQCESVEVQAKQISRQPRAATFGSSIKACHQPFISVSRLKFRLARPYNAAKNWRCCVHLTFEVQSPFASKFRAAFCDHGDPPRHGRIRAGGGRERASVICMLLCSIMSAAA